MPFKPSHLAAASLVFSLNLSASPIIEDVLDVKQIPVEKLEQRMKETLDLHNDIVGLKENSKDVTKATGPLTWWSDSIQMLTKVNRNDIAPVYTMLIAKLDSDCYEKKL